MWASFKNIYSGFTTFPMNHIDFIEYNEKDDQLTTIHFKSGKTAVCYVKPEDLLKTRRFYHRKPFPNLGKK